MNTASASAIALDAIVLAYLKGDEAVPSEVGDGFAITTTEDGGLQLALHWTDPADGVRLAALRTTPAVSARILDKLARAGLIPSEGRA